MSLTLITGPTEEPVSVSEAKAFIRQDADVDDSLIEMLIRAARQHIDGRDGWLGRALVTQTWDLSLDRFPFLIDPIGLPMLYDSITPAIVLPLPPLASITSVKYIDPNGATQTLATNAYVVDTASQPGRLAPVFGTTWPSTQLVLNAVTIRFVAGYGAASDVPEGLKLGIEALVAHWYENREAVGPSLVPLPMHVDALLAPFRIWQSTRIPQHPYGWIHGYQNA